MDSTTTTPSPKLVSLFAGAGGLDLGLEASGFQTCLASDVDEVCCQTLQANQEIPKMSGKEFDDFFEDVLSQRCHRSLSQSEQEQYRQRIERGQGEDGYLSEASVIQADVRELTSSRILQACGCTAGGLDLVAGGPPCQPFSKAGKRETVDDPKRGTLFMEFVRIVDETRPRFFLFENVKGLTFTRTELLKYACDACGQVGIAPFSLRGRWPSVDPDEKLCPECGSDAAHWGLEREGGGSLQIVLAEFERIGYECSWKILNAADFGAPQSRERLFIIGSRDQEEISWPLPSFRPSDAGAQAQLDAFADSDGGASRVRRWRTVYEALWADGHPEFGALDLDEAVLWVKNVVRPHDEPVTWPLTRVSPTVGAHQGAKLAVAPEGVPEEQIYRQQWHTKGRRQGDTPPVPVKHAYLNDEELLKLQTFPPFWYLHGTRMERAFQIGNAVPPVLGEAVGKSLMAAIRSGSSRSGSTELAATTAST